MIRSYRDEPLTALNIDYSRNHTVYIVLTIALNYHHADPTVYIYIYIYMYEYMRFIPIRRIHLTCRTNYYPSIGTGVLLKKKNCPIFEVFSTRK